MDNWIILYIDFKPFPLVKNIDIVNSPPGGPSGQLPWQLTKGVWLTAFLDKKKTFFV